MRKNSKLLLLTVIAFIQVAHAQNVNLEWAKQVGGTNVDIGYSMTIDASGNSYTTGYFSGTVDFDPGSGIFNITSSPGISIYILKLDVSGNFVWAKTVYGGEGKSITADASGNVYISGYFGTSTDFDPGAGVYNLTSVGGVNIFILKLDASGNFIWAKNIGGSGYGGYSIAVDGTGNVYTAGEFQGTGDFDPGAATFNLVSAGDYDIFISKLDASGNFVWAKKMGGAGTDKAYSLAVDGSGNVFSTGYFSGIADFDPGAGTFNLNSSGVEDIFISKLDASGNFLWANQIGGTAYDAGNGLSLDALGDVYTTGQFSGVADFNPGTGTFNLSSLGSYDIFVSKLDASGNFVWAKQMGGTGYDWGQALTLDSFGNIYTTGGFNSTADFDPGSGAANLVPFAIDVFVSKLDPSGNFVWAQQFGGINSGSEYTRAIKVDASENVYTAGYFSGSGADFDPGAGTLNFIQAGGNDVFVHKMSQCYAPSAAGTISGSTTVCEGQNSVTYTVPAIANATSYVWTLPSGATGTSGTNSITVNYGTAAVSGNITVKGNNSCGDGAISTLAVIVNSLPAVDAGQDQTICMGEQIILTGQGANTYFWNNGVQDGVAFIPNGTQSYIVTGTNTTTNCSNFDAVLVTVNSLPSINAGADQIICDGNAVTLSATGGVSYVWDNNVTNGMSFIPVHIGDQTYIVVGIDGNNCSNTDQVVVTVNEHTSAIQDQTALNSYTWPVNGQTYTQSGTYTAVIPNIAGCDSTITLNLSLNFTGIDEQINSSIVISPNPASEYVLVAVPENLLGQSYAILDYSGRKILEGTLAQKEQKIEIVQWVDGMYVFRINDAMQQTFRILKN